MEFLKFTIIFLICWFIEKILSFIYKNFIRKQLNFLERYGPNSWVLVTETTDGIGRQFCEEFSIRIQRNFSI
jgi:hypothetical protein